LPPLEFIVGLGCTHSCPRRRESGNLHDKGYYHIPNQKREAPPEGAAFRGAVGIREASPLERVEPID